MNFLLLALGALFGALAMYCGMRIWQEHKQWKADVEERMADLQEQIQGKQLPYFIKDGLEDVAALKTKDMFDLARLRLYADELIKTIDQAASRQQKMGEVYEGLRNHKKPNRRKGDKQA